MKKTETTWTDEIIKAIDKAIGDRSIGKEELAEGLEEIEAYAQGWAEQMRSELDL